MRILITGATGFVGHYIVKELVKRNYKIRCLIRDKKDIAKFPSSVEYHLGDLTSPETLRGICNDINVVVHLAAKTDAEEISMKKYKDFYKVNVTGTEYILNEAVKSKVSLFVYFSSLAAYGILTDRINLKKNNYNPKTPYEITKFKSEKLCLKYARKYGLNLAIIRPSMVYDFDQPQKDLDKLIKFVNIGFVPIIGNGNNIINIVSRKYLTEKILDIIQKKKNGIFIINEENVTMNQLIDRICRYYGKKCNKIHIPLSILYPIAGLIEKLEAFGFTPFLTRYRLKYISSSFKDQD